MAECIILSGDNQPDIIGLHSLFDSASFDHNLSRNSRTNIYIIISPFALCVITRAIGRHIYISFWRFCYNTRNRYAIHRRHLNEHNSIITFVRLINFISDNDMWRMIWYIIRSKSICKANSQLSNENNYWNLFIINKLCSFQNLLFILGMQSIASNWFYLE